jgi:hypothetical protein
MWHIWISSFGVTAAVLVVCGYILLQWQRNRYRFRLMQTALERGITDYFEGPPFWLISLRQGIAVLALGIGLIIVGAVAYILAQRVEPPEQPTVQSTKSVVAQDDSATFIPEAKWLKPDRPKPPPPNPALEKWHRAQDQQTLGLAAIGCGFLITLLGGVRTTFSFVERKHIGNARQIAS